MNRDVLMSCDCRSVFNRLSRNGRYALKGAATAEAITDFIQEDTRRRPWRFPFYAAYLIVMTTPLPFLGASTILTGATIAWAKFEVGPMAKRLNKHITDSFNEASVGCRYKDCIKEDPADNSRLVVKPLALAWHSTKKGAYNSYLAGKHAFNALRKLTL